MIYQPLLDTQAEDSSQMTVYPTSKIHLPETLSNFKTMSMPFRNGNRLGWCNSILWRVKAFVSPANRNLSLPLNYIIHERDLGESQICLVSGTQCRQQAQLEHPFHVYAVEKANATFIFLGPRRPLWDPSLNTHLLFGINIKKPKKKKKMGTPVVVVPGSSGIYERKANVKVHSYYTAIALWCRYINYFLPQVTAASLHFKLKWI